MTRVKSIQFSVLPPLATSIARDRSRVNEMLLQNSLLINAKGKVGSTRGRLQTNGKRRGLKGALQGGAGSLGRESSASFSNPCDHLTYFSEASEGRVHSVYNKYALGEIYHLAFQKNNGIFKT